MCPTSISLKSRAFAPSLARSLERKIYLFLCRLLETYVKFARDNDGVGQSIICPCIKTGTAAKIRGSGQCMERYVWTYVEENASFHVYVEQNQARLPTFRSSSFLSCSFDRAFWVGRVGSSSNSVLAYGPY